MVPDFRAAVRGIFGFAGSVGRYANSHSLPSLIGVRDGGISNRNYGACTMTTMQTLRAERA